MPDFIDAAQNEAHQVTQRVTMSTAQTGVRLSVKLAKNAAGTTVSTVHALLKAASDAVAELRNTGKVSMKEFAATGTARQLVDVDDAAVAKEMETTLKRYGVTFALEKGADGSRTFHVQGKDVQVVERALSVAAERIDKRIARNEARSKVGTRIDNGVKKKKEQKPASTRKPDKTLNPQSQGGVDASRDRPAPRR